MFSRNQSKKNTNVRTKTKQKGEASKFQFMCGATITAELISHAPLFICTTFVRPRF